MSEDHPIDELRKLEPHSLKVTLASGEERPVAVPKVRNRWARVHQILDSMNWVRVEALDKGGAVLGVVEDDDAAEELAGPDADERDIRMAKIIMEVVRSTQKETRAMFEVQIKGQAQLVDALIAGISSIANSYEEAKRIERATAVAEAAGGAQSNPEVMAMLQLAMASMNQPRPIAPPKPEGKKP